MMRVIVNGVSVNNWVNPIAIQMRTQIIHSQIQSLVSKAILPSEMSKLRDAVRQSFSEMYSEDWFTAITTQLTQQIKRKDELPPKPTLGDLDLTSVQGSNYFIT